MKKTILFLCTGNSCRSQMAEGFGRRIWKDKFDFFSAGFVGPFNSSERIDDRLPAGNGPGPCSFQNCWSDDLCVSLAVPDHRVVPIVHHTRRIG